MTWRNGTRSISGRIEFKRGLLLGPLVADFVDLVGLDRGVVP